MPPASEITAGRVVLPAVAAGQPPSHNFSRGYAWFILPALIVVAAVIVFPWLFTLWMSAHDWSLTGDHRFVAFENYRRLVSDERFLSSVVRTFWFTVLAVVIPIALGLWAALVFHRHFPWRGILRTIFVMPMMATPLPCEKEAAG